MPLQLKLSNSLSRLCGILAAKDRCGWSPFEQEYIVVASTGLRRWLSQEIATQRGILGNCAFPTPRIFVQQLLRDCLQVEESIAYTKESMTWRIYNILRDSDPAGELRIPVGYILKNTGNEDLAALQLSMKVADLFDQYLTYRPDWILAWDRGQAIPVSRDRLADPLYDKVRKHEHWQRCLWLELASGKQTHRAALYEDLLNKLSCNPVESLPESISIFGTHTLPPVFLGIFNALGQQHEVTLYLTQPTPGFWGDHPLKSLSGRSASFATETCPDGEDEQWGNPLIAAMGGQGRDLFNVLIDAGFSTSEEDDMELFQSPAHQTVLGSVQRSVYEIRERVARDTEVPAEDPSLRVHCCHHPLREIEILQDYLLDCFSKDPSLTPNDILVLAPDIDLYAPFIETVFGHPEVEQHRIPFSIADRTFRSKSRVVDGFYKILEVCRGRFSSADLFALFLSPVFRSRFGWNDDDLARMRTWLTETGTSWGIDAHHRASFGVPAFNEFSWDATFESLFTGYALPRHDPIDSHYDRIEGRDSILLGKLAEAFELLREIAVTINRAMPPGEWIRVIETKLVEPLLDGNQEGSLEVRQIRYGLRRLDETAGGMPCPVDLSGLLAFLETVIEDGIPARGFLSNGLTFGNLTPMRAIPHRIICLIGMDSGAFPRDSTPLGFDLMKIRGMSRAGDRAATQSGRYLFLETLLSAGEKLHISYSGYSPRDDSISPPATPVGELLDFLHLTWEPGENQLSKSPFHICHRLHGHHPQYYEGTDRRMFSYSDSKYKAAIASLSGKSCHEVGGIRYPSIPETVSSSELCDFITNPARHFLKNQMGIRLPYGEKDLLKDEPLELGSLESHSLLESRIYQRIGWSTRHSFIHVPPGKYGEWCRRTVEEHADHLYNELNALAQFDQLGPPGQNTVHFRVELDSREIAVGGEFSTIYGETQIRFRPAELKPKDQLRAWIDHIVLNASGYPATTRLLHGKRKIGEIFFPEMTRESALGILEALLRHYISGQSIPLPWILECSLAYGENLLEGQGEDISLSAALEAWSPNSRFSIHPPSTDPWVLLCWGHQPPFMEPHREHFSKTALSILEPFKAHQRKL